MENKEQQILSEIKEMMASIRSQLELLDAKMAELQQATAVSDEETTPIDLDIEDLIVEEFTGDEIAEVPAVPAAPEVLSVPEVSEVPEMSDALEAPEVSELMVERCEPEEEPEEEPECELECEPETEPDIDDLPFDDIPVAEEPVTEEHTEDDGDDDLPIFAEPEPVPVQPTVQTVVKPQTAVIDAMAARQAWRTDMPGTPVKDIRSAISLNDRILFINMLFNQDPMSFQEALTRINQMASLDEVAGYVVEEHPEWDLDSEFVYRFMMAVRRKVR